jgi:hypothetical protein
MLASRRPVPPSALSRLQRQPRAPVCGLQRPRCAFIIGHDPDLLVGVSFSFPTNCRRRLLTRVESSGRRERAGVSEACYGAGQRGGLGTGTWENALASNLLIYRVTEEELEP